MNDELKIGYALTVAVASLSPASALGTPSGIPSSEIGVTEGVGVPELDKKKVSPSPKNSFLQNLIQSPLRPSLVHSSNSAYNSLLGSMFRHSTLP
jgi:hypothetical protein